MIDRKTIVALAAVALTGCVSVDPGATRAPAPLRPIGEVAGEATSLGYGSYQQRVQTPKARVMEVTHEVVRQMGLQVLTSTPDQVVAQFSDGTKLYITLGAQSPELTLIDIRAAPFNETVSLTAMRRIKQRL